MGAWALGQANLSSCGTWTRWFGHVGSVIVAHGLSWSTACGIFLGLGSNRASPALTGEFFTTVPSEALQFLGNILDLLVVYSELVQDFTSRGTCLIYQI